MHTSTGLNIWSLSLSDANIYVVESNSSRIMVDTGNAGDANTITVALRDIDIDPKKEKSTNPIARIGAKIMEKIRKKERV